MRLAVLSEDTYDAFIKGNDNQRGRLVVDSEGIVHWISLDELRTYKGIGPYSGADGYQEYESEEE